MVKKFKCRECGTEVVGEFKRSKFSKLSPELQEFVELDSLSVSGNTRLEDVNLNIRTLRTFPPFYNQKK